VAILLGGGQPAGSGSVQVIVPAEAADLIDQLRALGTVLTCDPDRHTLRSGDSGTIAVTAARTTDSTGRRERGADYKTEHPPRPEAEPG
jgi:hypothetical protein